MVSSNLLLFPAFPSNLASAFECELWRGFTARHSFFWSSPEISIAERILPLFAECCARTFDIARFSAQISFLTSISPASTPSSGFENGSRRFEWRAET